jgi:hypothetical protein
MAKKGRPMRGKVDPVSKLAREIGLPTCQVAVGGFETCDVVNHTEADHRAMVRSLGAQMLNPDARRTLRRTSKLATKPIRKLLDDRELAACEWYMSAHSLRYDTTGTTVRYGGVGGRASTNFDHMPKTPEQQEAYDNFEFARAGINRFLVGMFERVVLYGRPLGRLRLSFKLAAGQLLERIEGRVQL